MRKKSITLLICVYAALCISYSVISNGVVPGGDGIQTYSPEISSIASQSASSNSLPDTASGKPSLSQTESSYVSEKKDSSSANEPSSYNETTKPEESSVAITEPSEEAIESYESSVDNGEQIEEQDEYQQDKPSLTDYLSGLRCSGCRHNCSLLSPRCMNGSRKASQAESAYYAAYGA